MQENNSKALQLVRAIGQKLREHKADIIILALLFIIGFCGAYMLSLIHIYSARWAKRYCSSMPTAACAALI